ncbi:hypothetical protein [Methylocystis hirsuta]|uniref:Helix-turn-helix domain-containing protein n=1 Tax=Methylocystis hirsuta TaxID=369798 RepID=A0A3M9XPR8_9HYPH|nr:hypothetical protein [Methylocystis hirsuta]RNJ50289.1 hypothetical protein D1O30_12460 [Methylocystis hirsuta]
MADDSAQRTSLAAFKFRWLRSVAQLAVRQAVPPSVGIVAIMIVELIDPKTWTIEASMQYLAEAVGMTPRGLRKIISALVKDKHLVVDVGRGRGVKNSFMPILPDAVDQQKIGTPVHILRSEKPERSFPKSGTVVPVFDSEKPERSFPKTGTSVPPIHNIPFSLPYSPKAPITNDEEVLLGFDQFEAVFPISPIDSRRAAQRAWNGLSEEDKRHAIEAAPHFVAEVRRVERKLCAPATFLRERRWEEFALKRDSAAPRDRRSEFWIARGTAEYSAWITRARAQKRTIPEHQSSADGSFGFWRRTKFPPGHQAHDEVDCGSGIDAGARQP